MLTDSLYYYLWCLRLELWILISHHHLFTDIITHNSKASLFSGKRAANQSIQFQLALKSEHIRSALLDEFSSREACSSSAFCSSKVGTYCSQEELLLRIYGHGDVFIPQVKVRIRQKKRVHIWFPLQNSIWFKWPLI